MTFLSHNVRLLLRIGAEPCRDDHLKVQAEQCVGKEGHILVFEDHPVQMLVKGVNLNEPDRDFQWYKTIVRKLAPLFQHAHKLVLGEQFQPDLHQDPALQWLTHPQLFQECVDLIQKREDKTVSIETLLMLTPMLERSLGNILFTLNKKLKIPSLLRDLIATEELRDALSSNPALIILLHVLLGTCKGLNLRNLVWHGFPCPSEISPVYVSTLIVLALSVGDALRAKGIEFVDKRPFVDLLAGNGLLAKTEKLHSKLSQELVEQLPQKFLDSIGDGNPKGPILQRVHRLTHMGKYRSALYLLLPEWEAVMRTAFVEANNCPERSMTAENDTLYTTFDEILANPDEQLNNAFPDQIGKGHMRFLLDCLQLPEGPRIRDKISHGEVDLSEEMTVQIFKMWICLVWTSMTNVFREDYCSLFHPKALLVQELSYVADMISDIRSDQSLAEHLAVMPDDPLKKLSKDLMPMTNIKTFCESVQLKTLFRPKNEVQLVQKLRRILAMMRLTCERTLENMEDKRDQNEAGQLNSRQLATYGRMLNTVPRVCLVFHLWMPFMMEFVSVHKTFGKQEQHYKKMLQYAENLAKNSHLVKNRWEESSLIVDRAAKQLTKLHKPLQMR